MTFRPVFLARTLACLLLAMVCMASAAPAAEPGKADVSSRNRKLGRGVNIIVYDIDNDRWVQPIYDALIPKEPCAPDLSSSALLPRR